MFYRGPTTVSTQRWTLLVPDGGSAEFLPNTNLTTTGAYDTPGGTFDGIVDAGAPDPSQPVRLAQAFTVNGTLNVVGALSLLGSTAPTINLNGPVHVQPGGQLNLSLAINLNAVADLSGGSLSFSTGSCNAVRSTVRFDAPGANVTVDDNQPSSLVVQDFRAGDTITVPTGLERAFVHVGGND